MHRTIASSQPIIHVSSASIPGIVRKYHQPFSSKARIMHRYRVKSAQQTGTRIPELLVSHTGTLSRVSSRTNTVYPRKRLHAHVRIRVPQYISCARDRIALIRKIENIRCTVDVADCCPSYLHGGCSTPLPKTPAVRHIKP